MLLKNSKNAALILNLRVLCLLSPCLQDGKNYYYNVQSLISKLISVPEDSLQFSNSETILMSTQNICFCRGDSNEKPQHMFFAEAILMSSHNICFCRGDSNE